MTIEEISKKARDGSVPKDMTCPERCLYYALKELYGDFTAGRINKTAGEKLKAQAIRQYEEDKAELDRGKNILRLHAEMWKNIESASNSYRLDPTIENADNFLEAVYGCGRKEDTART